MDKKTKRILIIGGAGLAAFGAWWYFNKNATAVPAAQAPAVPLTPVPAASNTVTTMPLPSAPLPSSPATLTPLAPAAVSAPPATTSSLSSYPAQVQAYYAAMGPTTKANFLAGLSKMTSTDINNIVTAWNNWQSGTASSSALDAWYSQFVVTYGLMNFNS
jgi:hypothetical protein